MECINCKKLKERNNYLESLLAKHLVGNKYTIDEFTKDLPSERCDSIPFYGVHVEINPEMPNNKMVITDASGNVISLLYLKGEKDE